MDQHAISGLSPVTEHSATCLCCSPLFNKYTRRISADLSRRRMMLALGASVAAVGLGVYPASVLSRPQESHPTALVFTNMRLFDGKSAALRDGVEVIVEGDKVTAVRDHGAPRPEGAEIIDGRGGVLMPGLIDAHWHATMAAVPKMAALTADVGYLHIVAANEAERTLMRGFTSVRDAAGPVFALKRAVDEGLVLGPRIYPSGAMISQTSGHGDYRLLHELPRFPGTPPSHSEELGVGQIADGRDEVLRRVREQLMQGATQIKLAAGGGVSSVYDPIEVTQYTEDELRAAVEAAEDYGTYVMVHAYTPRAIQRAIRAGVRCIEHGQLMDDETAALVAETGTLWSLQPFLADEDANPMATQEQRDKQQLVARGTVRAYELARKHGIDVAFGTDTLFNAELAARQGRQLAKLGRFFSNMEVLRMATSGNARYLQACGIRDPYPAPLGVIEEGAWADMLLFNGNPAENLDLLGEPERSMRVIVKNGRIVKMQS